MVCWVKSIFTYKDISQYLYVGILLTGIIIQTICCVILELIIDPLKCNSQQRKKKHKLSFTGVPNI